MALTFEMTEYICISTLLCIPLSFFTWFAVVNFCDLFTKIAYEAGEMQSFVRESNLSERREREKGKEKVKVSKW